MSARPRSSPTITCLRSKRRRAPTICSPASPICAAAGRVMTPPGVGVLVKAPKPGQDRRFDLPAIGPRTIENVARAGLAGLAVAAGSTIVAEPDAVVAAADRARIFFVGVCARTRRDERCAASGDRFRSISSPAEESGDALGAALARALTARAGGGAEARGRRRPRHGGGRDCQPIPYRRPLDHRHRRDPAPAADESCAASAKLRTRSSPPARTRWSSSTAPISPIASRAGCGGGRRRIPILDYVSPSVWAWRPWRARAMRAYVDYVLAILPFEPAVHVRARRSALHSMSAIRWSSGIAELRPNAEEAQRRKADPPVVLVLPGSRSSEMRRLLAIFGAAIEQVADGIGPLELVSADSAACRRAGARGRRRTGRSRRVSWSTRPRNWRRSGLRARRWRRPARSRSNWRSRGCRRSRPTACRGSKRSIMRMHASVQTVILANLVIGENIVPEFLQSRLHAGASGGGAAAIVADTPRAPAADRGLRAARSHHGDRNRRSQRQGRRYRPRRRPARPPRCRGTHWRAAYALT